MIELSRTVRFCVDFGKSGAEAATNPAGAPRHNTFAGWPSMRGLGAYYELDVRCTGEPDPATGYLLNISAIDEAVRQHALPVIEGEARRTPQRDPARVLALLAPALQPVLRGRLRSIRWRLSPYYSLDMSIAAPHRVLLSQQFEFSASHRLHVREFSDQRNREIFGKCNNPNSHGHNYRLEVAISRAVDDSHALTLPEIERIVNETVIQRFDHKHLNHDTREFATLNPSVENIAKVCYELLAVPMAGAGGELKRVTVWETEKTSCTYPAE
jgi:6-pyruvoyltetrahydropterin/6-carboxytetrahydropterin synthase